MADIWAVHLANSGKCLKVVSYFITGKRGCWMAYWTQWCR